MAVAMAVTMATAVVGKALQKCKRRVFHEPFTLL
jgi:hypothetical protein